MSKPKLLICSSGLGAGKKGAELGPFALRIAFENRNSQFFRNKELSVLENDHSAYSHSSKFKADYLNKIVEFNEQICSEVNASYRFNDKLIVMSGDHSNAVGSLSGLRKAHPDAKIGVIWIDAHADFHSPYSTPSFNIHGMPLAALCGLNNQKIGDADPVVEQIDFWNSLKAVGGEDISPKLSPQDIVFIGIRDLEQPEWDVIQQNHINYFAPEHIQNLGIEKVAEETLKLLAEKDVLYITFDVDSMDPSISKGTGTPVEHGISEEQAAYLLKKFYHDSRCKMLEITEINPLLDIENRMAQAVVTVLGAAEIE